MLELLSCCVSRPGLLLIVLLFDWTLEMLPGGVNNGYATWDTFELQTDGKRLVIPGLCRDLLLGFRLASIEAGYCGS